MGLIVILGAVVIGVLIWGHYAREEDVAPPKPDPKPVVEEPKDPPAV